MLQVTMFKPHYHFEIAQKILTLATFWFVYGRFWEGGASLSLYGAVLALNRKVWPE